MLNLYLLQSCVTIITPQIILSEQIQFYYTQTRPYENYMPHLFGDDTNHDLALDDTVTTEPGGSARKIITNVFDSTLNFCDGDRCRWNEIALQLVTFFGTGGLN